MEIEKEEKAKSKEQLEWEHKVYEGAKEFWAFYFKQHPEVLKRLMIGN